MVLIDFFPVNPHSPRNSLGLTVEFNLSLEKSWNSVLFFRVETLCELLLLFKDIHDLFHLCHLTTVKHARLSNLEQVTLRKNFKTDPCSQ